MEKLFASHSYATIRFVAIFHSSLDGIHENQGQSLTFRDKFCGLCDLKTLLPIPIALTQSTVRPKTSSAASGSNLFRVNQRRDNPMRVGSGEERASQQLVSRQTNAGCKANANASAAFEGWKISVRRETYEGRRERGSESAFPTINLLWNWFVLIWKANLQHFVRWNEYSR